MQRDEYLAGVEEAYTLTIRDYAVGLLRGGGASPSADACTTP